MDNNVTLEQVLEALKKVGASEQDINNIELAIKFGVESVETYAANMAQTYGDRFNEALGIDKSQILEKDESGWEPLKFDREDSLEDDFDFFDLDLDEDNYDSFADELERYERDLQEKIDSYINVEHEKYENLTQRDKKYFDNLLKKYDMVDRERLAIESKEESKVTEDDRKDFEYLQQLFKILRAEMYEISPIDYITAFNWAYTETSEAIQYTPEEAKEILHNHISYKVYQDELEKVNEEYKAKVEELRNYEAENPIRPIDDENYQQLIGEEILLSKKCELLEKNELAALLKCYSPVRIHTVENFDIDAGISNISEQHTEYMTRLLNKTKSLQARQVELLSDYEIGNIEDPKEEVKDIGYDVSDLARKMSYFQRIGKMYNINQDFEKILEQEGNITRASGTDMLGLMNSKQKYKAKETIYRMQNSGKKPGWIKKLSLKLPSRKMDEVIAMYIDDGKLNTRRIMNVTPEDIGVQKESEKIAKETRINRKVNELLDLADQMSPEGRINAYAQIFGLDEKGKEIFTMFEGLSQEAKENVYQNMFGEKVKNKDKEHEKE